MFMCNVYQGMTTYLGTWSYESGVLTLTRPSAEETYVFFAQDADTLLMLSLIHIYRRLPAQRLLPILRARAVPGRQYALAHRADGPGAGPEL